MTKDKIKAPVFDEIVFEDRNKEYGAYIMRKKYKGTLIFAMIIGTIIFSTVVVVPFLKASQVVHNTEREEVAVVVEMQNLDVPDEIIVPPEPEAPPPAAMVETVKYIAPVVVDSIAPEEQGQLMSAAEAVETIVDVDVSIEEVAVVQEEVVEEEAPIEVFVIVEEMPSFPGGDVEMMNFINTNIKYPEIAKENNIQGRVFLRFCVTYKGTVEQISILKGVDPALDEEAIRVVSLLPAWKPGKQGGKPVNVWFQLPITFQLKQ